MSFEATVETGITGTDGSAVGPLISVIIPHLDDVDRLRHCIRALERQTLPRHSYEIIVGDNGSCCGLDVVEAAAAGHRVVSVAERGAGPARNAAVAVAQGQMLAFTDSDCVPDPDWLRQGLAAMDNLDIAGGDVVVGVGNAAAPNACEAFELVFAFDNRGYVEKLGFSVTANLFTRRQTFGAVGGFRVGVPEDLDWCRRARACGFSIGYAPGARVTHPARRDFVELSRKWRRLTDEAFADWRGQGGSRAGWCLRAFGVLASPAVHAMRAMTSPRIGGVRTRALVLGTLARIRALRCRWMLMQALEWRADRIAFTHYQLQRTREM